MLPPQASPGALSSSLAGQAGAREGSGVLDVFAKAFREETGRAAGRGW